ncbi:MAG: carboxypeptidase regulatory-like domain-containing protein [Saprospiraceae bacterium]|nr:carboxypeptidase regulatory-like domain-containing protein [Saprospiraceae bacterium]
MNNGSNAQSIQPNAPGTYCVTTTDANGCVTSDCYWYGSFPDTCSVYITLDSTNTGGGLFTANPSGTAPFTYAWNLGQNTQSIPLDPAYFGEYCVTVTDANGCISTDCIFGSNNGCSVWIFESDTIVMTGLYAIASAPSNVISYLWSTGETSSVIFPNNVGTYCVTIQGGGCTATACYTYQMVNNFNISGYLYFPDSSIIRAQCREWSNCFSTHQTTMFGNQWAQSISKATLLAGRTTMILANKPTPGNYIVKATLDPNSPGASGYMPTCHFSTVHWDEADLITLPSAGSGLFNLILNDGSNFTGGSGNINGTVTQGDGFTTNGEGDRSGDPRPNTSVLLFDSNELPITHTLTDEQGQYSFGSLPFGTYKLEVEIVGMEQAVRWVTLSADNPTSSGNDFEVTEEGIVLGINELLAGSGLEASPNQLPGDLNIWLRSQQQL